MYYSHPYLYDLSYRYPNDGFLYDSHLNHHAVSEFTPQSDERFFPFLPFVAGLAIGPLLLAPFFLNRPYFPPYGPIPYGPAPYPPMYPAYAAMPPFPSNYYPNNGGITENINIYTK